MDILSHGLWAVAAGKASEKTTKKRLSLGRVFFWGVFPDLFAFTIPFIWRFYNVLTRGVSFGDFPRPTGQEPPAEFLSGPLDLAYALYNWSHSFVILAGVLFVVYFLSGRKIPWAMMGWPLHIMMDIFSHTYKIFPTPFLWPVSGFEISGVSWATPWFMLANYSALALTYLLVFWTKRRNVEFHEAGK